MLHNLKTLKQKYSKEEQAFSLVKKKYPFLSEMSDSEIFSYFECKSRNALVRLVKDLKKIASDDVDKKMKMASVCNCKDANGKMKNLYEDKKDAERMCRFVLNQQSITLTIYECPVSDGWHLSKG